MEKIGNEPKWYAIYTRPRWEKKVADLFTRKKIEHYCPLNKVESQWSDRKKVIMEPLFKSYVFVRVIDKQFIAVHETDGVINFVHWLGSPAIIRDYEIAAIKNFLDDHESVQLEKTEVNLNETVRIIKGPLMAREGNVIEVFTNSIKVVLPSLGYALVAHVNKNHIEKVKVLSSNSSLSEPIRMKVNFR